MTSCRARRMSEGRLKREYVDSPLHSVYGTAVPQLVRVNKDLSMATSDHLLLNVGRP